MQTFDQIIDTVINIYRDETDVSEEFLYPDMEISKLDIDSVDHMKIIVLIEDMYGFEFTKEELKMDKFNTIKDMVIFIEHKIQGNNG